MDIDLLQQKINLAESLFNNVPLRKCNDLI